MFGTVWPLAQWAGLGALLGVAYQAVQVINQGLFSQGYSFVSGRLLGGAIMGAIFGAVIAFLRNQLAGKKR
ncbi:MAG: hypothetical protein AB7O79_08225 [Xanthobacteraceae bacterium]|jgi:hypothetical protein